MSSNQNIILFPVQPKKAEWRGLYIIFTTYGYPEAHIDGSKESLDLYVRSSEMGKPEQRAPFAMGPKF